jgi:hypothetical protein
VPGFVRDLPPRVSRLSGTCKREDRLGIAKYMTSWVRVPYVHSSTFSYFTLVSLPGEPPHHPRPGNIFFMPIKPRPRVRSNDNTPRRTPPSTRLVTPSHTPPGSSTPGNVSPQVRVFNILLRTKLNVLIAKRESFSSEDDYYRSAFFS